MQACRCMPGNAQHTVSQHSSSSCLTSSGSTLPNLYLQVQLSGCFSNGGSMQACRCMPSMYSMQCHRRHAWPLKSSHQKAPQPVREHPAVGDNSWCICGSRPVGGLAPDGPSVVHGCSPGSLHWVQVLKWDGPFKQLVGNHGEGIHIHLQVQIAGLISNPSG